MIDQQTPCLINAPKKTSGYKNEEQPLLNLERWGDWTSGHSRLGQKTIGKMYSASWAGK